MKIKIKKLNAGATIPFYAKPGDAGLDLTAVKVTEEGADVVCYHTGLCVEIPEGYVGLLFPRSSVSKTALSLTNSVGVIDSSYRGEIILKFYERETNQRYRIFERIGQLIIIPYPQIEFEQVSELSNTERGSGAFGSTGA